MKRVYSWASLFVITGFAFQSCQNNQPIVEKYFVDSLQSVYTSDSLLASNEQNRIFWGNRINPHNPSNINELQYAYTFINRFKLQGNIQDLDSAIMIMKKVDTTFAHTLSGPLLSLVSASIMHHRFSEADSFYLKACKIGIKEYQRTALGFDVDFELGYYKQAAIYLKSMRGVKDYNYFFRRSKMDHLNGNTDSALSSMEQAVSLAGKSPILQNLSWSMLGDLQVHQGDLEDAANSLKQAIRVNPGDMHSILQLGWIALMQNKDTAIVNKLFQIAINRNHLPDPYYKLYQMAQWEHNSTNAKKYAQQFEQKAALPAYESMYSKYLIELYATILNQPQRAEEMAFAELKNRATPETYAWYAYSLLCNHQKEKVYQIFQQYVAGKPIEGIELYYIGKVLKSVNHGLDAEKCFEAAMQNKYDLSPYMIEDMEKMKK
ncbi:MAG: hypothetical protein DI598_16280 [Pseudopedobacter saltans]|uniref:Uncharacterized protein n=1 Tax=Pseudopedobacter saltans TaxID=151895 RepID=A0A2W5GI80_9SPHI|nr:MAG: hypothetical protein DI598_16280 [Pseudopedobacter saltans]